MIKAVIGFTKDGTTISAGDEIKPDTFGADVLLQSLLDKGLIVIVPSVPAEEKPQPKKSKHKGG